MVSAIFINPKELIFSLLKKLNLHYRKTKFIFNEKKYCISRSLDFEEIELTSDRAFRIKKFVIKLDFSTESSLISYHASCIFILVI